MAQASEAAREREVHRFYQPWLETFHTASAPEVVDKDVRIPRDDGHIPQSSKDRSLTAFAQLGALRLNAKRGVVTLIDSKSQFILAEATKSLSLMDDSCYEPGDELWLGNARIPRSQGVSEDAMAPPIYVATGPDRTEYRASAMVIEDMAKDPRYKGRKYAGAGINFYCGVPIVTRRGITIGVYNVTDSRPRDGLKIDELRFMVDMASLVVQHLETICNERARARGERLIQGIGTFIEGNPIEANLSLGSPDAIVMEDPMETAATQVPPTPTRPKLQHRDSSATFKGLSIRDANLTGREQYDSPEHTSHRSILPPVRKDPVENNKDPSRAKQKPKSQHALVFDRAANILRRCLGADGVAFLDASSANLSKGTARKSKKGGDNSRMQHTSSSKRNAQKQQSRTSIDSEDELADGQLEGSLSMESQDDSAPEKAQMCELIAQAAREGSSEVSLDVAEHTLRKLVRRHPQGKCYTFDAYGQIASSDDSASASEGAINAADLAGDRINNETPVKRKDIRKNGLIAALPNARSVVFLPLWDFSNQRWNATAVIWSASPAKLMNVRQDFSYLRAFANSVMNEIARLNLSVSDAAKATFLANISHELRSPLHGILGSIEFLHDTALDDFQSGMVISVETCGKTLLDTVNHVLDFAKLNNLSKRDGRRKNTIGAEGASNRPLTSTFDLATIVEEGVEAVYAGQVFRSASHDAMEGSGPARSSSDKNAATRRHQRDEVTDGQAVAITSVLLTLNVDYGINWYVTSQPGAVRRIVMNLLGNALKYTERGSINVSLEIDSSRKHEKEAGFLHACITVTDTGKGMSDDFVRNHAFTAFSQEDSLAIGTGLGLSIIRSIVDSLGGKIDLRSQKDLGTEVKIWLSLPAADDADDVQNEKSIYHQTATQTAGMSLCLLTPNVPSEIKPVRALRPMPTVNESFKSLLTQWFSLSVSTAPNMNEIEGVDFFIYAEPPPIEKFLQQHGERGPANDIPVIIFCQNAFQASSLRNSGIHNLIDIGRIIEVISQPVGPQKLAKVFHRCLQRLKMLDTNKQSSANESVSLSHDVNNAKEGTTHGPVQGRRLPEQSSTVNPSKIEVNSRPQTQRRQSSRDYDSNSTQSPLSPPVRPGLGSRQRSQSVIDTSLPSVLVVDDNHINLQLMVTFVRKAHHAYEAASDGLLAVDAYKHSATNVNTQQPDGNAPSRFRYILMDINMPRMDGIAATKEIRKWEKQHGIHPPVLIYALTGLGELEHHDWAEEAGFDKLLSKPIKFKDLKELLV